MKLRYQFEIMDMGDGTFAAVPVGEGAENFHAMASLNDVAADMLRAVEKSSSPEEALELLKEQYPDEPVEELGQNLCDFLNQLVAEGMLDPDAE